MRKSILLLFAFVAVSTTAFAQEEGSSRSFYFYVDGNTGNINEQPGYDKEVDSSQLFDKYWACAGLGYEHGFDNGFGFSVGAVVFDTAAKGYTSSTGEWVDGGNVFDYVTANAGVSYGIGGFSSYVTLTTAYIVETGLAYSHSFGAAGSVKVGVDACFSVTDGYIKGENVVYTGYGDNGTYETEDAYNVAVGIVDYLDFNVQYSVGFAEKWGFSSKAMFRFGGDYENADGYDVYADSSAFAFGQSFYIRWNNTVSYQATDNLGLYAQLRYQAFDLTKKVHNDSGDWVAADVDHRLSIGAGLSYSFDLK